VGALTVLALVLASLPARVERRPRYETCSRRVEPAIELVMTRPMAGAASPVGFDCHAVLVRLDSRRVLADVTVLDTAAFEHGLVQAPGLYGLYRILVKLGDLDGRLLLVGPGQSVKSLPGGPFVVLQERYLVAHHHPDPGSIVIIDLETGRDTLRLPGNLTGVDESARPEFFDAGGRLVFGLPRNLSGEDLTVQLVDVAAGKISPLVLTAAEVKRLTPLSWIAPIHPDRMRCGCGPDGE
jgi:hypothetical protein